MSEPFLGEIRIMSFNYPPKGWATCDGQVLPINQNQALFSLLGTVYGGNGQTTFALPDLRGRMPLHTGPGFNPGAAGGEEAHTLVQAEMPKHTHPVQALTDAADQGNPAGMFWANAGQNNFNPAGNTTMSTAAIGASGGGTAHDNMSPFLVVNFSIALTGIFPSRN
ncbi:MAG TPA: tail fiber protein [Candidatus Dormibacteraeota bacterium]|jgi:microcystin-dependent protein|nr:tail fiber protein [Candidatus Dormibacteraeota bacterium]